MTTPHTPGDPHYPGDPDMMESVLINEILQAQAQIQVDLLGASSAAVLRAASTEALGKQAERYENLADLYRRLAVRRSTRLSGETAP
jgi:hypothetical protein